MTHVYKRLDCLHVTDCGQLLELEKEILEIKKTIKIELCIHKIHKSLKTMPLEGNKEELPSFIQIYSKTSTWQCTILDS